MDGKTDIDIPEDLFSQIADGNCVVFVGAGLSLGAGLPGWPDLLRRMVDWAEKHSKDMSDRAQLEELIEDGELLLVAEEMRERLGEDDFQEFMNEVFCAPDLKLTDVHKLLPGIPFAAVLTSNYDNLLESAYATANGKIPTTFTQKDYPKLARALRKRDFYVLKVHGTIDRIETVILGINDYREVMYNNKAYRDYLTALFSTKTVLFLGFALTDPDLLMFLNEMRATFSYYTGKHYALMHVEEVPSIKQKWFEKHYNVQIIPYEDHSEVPVFLEQLGSTLRLYLQSLLKEFEILMAWYVRLMGLTQTEEGLFGIIEPELIEHTRQPSGQMQQEQARLENLLELVNKPYNVILVGEPGSGKTTALRHIALRVAEESLKLGTEGRIPILSYLSNLHNDDVKGWIRKHCELPESYFDNYIKSGRCIFLWDALNEMPAKDEEEYTKKINALKKFMGDYPNNHFIWSCRRLDYLAYRENLPLQQVEIVPLSDEQIRQFLYNLRGIGAGDAGERLLSQLETDRAQGGSLWELFRRPLMLELLYIVYIKNRRNDRSEPIPKNRGRLFEEFVNILMMREERRAGLLSHRYPPEVLKPKLGELAFAMMNASGTAMESNVRSGTSIPVESAHLYLPGEDLEEMAAASEGILELSPDRLQVRFWHQSLQEYFAAIELERQLYSGEDLTQIFKPQWSKEAWRSKCRGPLPVITGDWEETLIILAGICQKPDKLICSIMKENLILAGHCIIEGGARISDPLLLKKLACELSKVIEQPGVEESNIALRIRLSAGYLIENLGLEESSIPLKKISESLSEVFQERPSTDRFWREMHIALYQSFGIYPKWPGFLRASMEQASMEKDDDQKIMRFLGSMHDMEGRHDKAVEVLRKALENTDEDNLIRTATIRELAAALRHAGRQKKAFEELNKLISRAEANGEPRKNYCWDEYQRGITFIELCQYDKAKVELESLYRYGRLRGLRTSALHHLGVVDLELDDLEQAADKFRRCLERRKRWSDHRMAYEYRRLGQVYALEGSFEIAEEKFSKAIEISSSYIDLRYVKESQRDITMFLKAPRYVIDEQPEAVELAQFLKQSCTNEWLLFRAGRHFSDGLDPDSLPDGLRREFEDNFISLPDNVSVSVMERGKIWMLENKSRGEQYIIRLEEERLGIYDKPHLAHAFRVLSRNYQTYLEIINPDSAEFSGEVVRQDICHRNGAWYASVTVLIMCGKEEIALLLRRDEDESEDTYYELIANHKEVLEGDSLTAVREIRRKLGLTIGTQKLTRIGKPYEFRRMGKPQVRDEQNGNSACYVYRTDGNDCECVSVFVLNLSESEKEQVGTAAEWMSISDAAGTARNNPSQFGIAFRHLFVHDYTANRIAEEIRSWT